MPSKIYPSIKSTGRKIGNSSHFEMASQFLSAIFLSAVQAFLPARCSKGRQRYPLPKRWLANAKRCLPDAVAGRFGTAVIMFLRCNCNFDSISYQIGLTPPKIYHLAQKALGGKYETAVILKRLRSFYRRFFSQQFKRSCLPDAMAGRFGTAVILVSSLQSQLWLYFYIRLDYAV